MEQVLFELGDEVMLTVKVRVVGISNSPLTDKVLIATRVYDENGRYVASMELPQQYYSPIALVEEVDSEESVA